MNIDDRRLTTNDQRPTNDRPTSGPIHTFWENFKRPYLSDVSADPPHVWFSGGVFGDGGSNGAIFGWIKFKMAAGGHLGKPNGHISATCHPIDFVFGSRVGFSGTADPTAPFPVGSNSRWRPAAILENFTRPYLSNVLCDSLYVLCTQTILCRRSL